MSRDTDNPPPGPLGWGEPQRSEGDGDARPAPRAGEKKTETTLTTRARINIPGSRPIPPIVVRETVDEPAARDTPAPPSPPPAAGVTGAGAAGGAAGGKKTSSWFEPKKPPAPKGGAAPRPTPPTAPETPPGGHPAVPETPASGIPEDWFRQPADTPPAGTPLGLPPRPVGPTSGPVTGDMPVPPAPAAPRRPEPPLLPEEEDPVGTTMDLGGPFPPAPPPDVTATGPMAALAAPFAGPPGPEPGPAVPPPGPRPPAAVAEAEPEPKPKPAAPAAAKRKGGRSKLRLLAIGVVGIAVVAYGAGLYLSPEDVPRGTTVLGVDIGGLSSDEAQERLDSALKQANDDPLTLRIGEREVELKPSVAGLSVDTEATVQAVSGQDYSPVAVFGSLLGAERTENAEFAVDREKLTVALQDIADQAGSGPVEGTVVFENGEAIGRLGEPGTAVDLQAAADAVESAFRERAATGRNPAIELPMTNQEPTVGEAQVQQALQEFGEPAMSGWVWVMAGENYALPLSEQTLSNVLSMAPSDEGNLQPVIDTEALEVELEGYFDGVMIDGGAGVVPITMEHIAAALIPALRETATVNDGPGRREAVVEGAIG
ncbi:peptidoglycan binding domain-containing protein [Streptomyces litchfieldiae]|uniref:Peptidoglycan binding domain-containing protein n=1 Tax=Streptomyces litchfieldiae TaxID=3075543 RepID=A0ABU2MMB5_9ACTN|nr:hypothetical protein [Streptomyces sp. DSM 44938]MDT0342508.1 hypothetical protein [Streptomyces sp. DSM 44938]